MLDAFIKDLPNQPAYGYDPASVAEISGIDEDTADRISRHLVECGYLRSESTPPVAGLSFGDRYYLTEKGRKYQAIYRQKIKRYIADKWIDFFALLIAAIALIKSFWPDIMNFLNRVF